MKLQINISKKLFSLVALIIAVFIVICIFSGLRLVNTIHETRNSTARAAVEVVFGIVNQYYNDYKSGKISEDDAKKNALIKIKSLRYEGMEYF